MSGYHNYDRFPFVRVSQDENDCKLGWPEILSELRQKIPVYGRHTVAFEVYPGVLYGPIIEKLKEEFKDAQVFDVHSAYCPSTYLQAKFESTLTDDPVFGVMRSWKIKEFFDKDRVNAMRRTIQECSSLIILIGTGTNHVLPNPDFLLHGGVTRWELQRRQRVQEIGNLGFDNAHSSPSVLYKNAFFLEWRIADEIRHSLYRRVDFFLDLDEEDAPRMVAGDTLRGAAAKATRGPFRVVPFFDPGPWGGEWMRETFDLPDGPPNYAWCFDCVPEENAVTLAFGERRFQMPAILLVHEHPLALLGDSVYRRFGAEFPIRFYLLDTVEGGNLSLQVHPLASYIKEQFGMAYTQDESYYILDCRPGSKLYLGLRDGVDREQMKSALEAAQAREAEFCAECFVNVLPTRKHDHFSIPAGTVHCSGSNNLVLEISATPYIFTFKLWDWGRVGLNGKPRPIHLAHGLANIQWDRNSTWVQQELLDQIESVLEGQGWREERTGLHGTEFLETRRTWFTDPVCHDTQGNLHVLNLVEGEAISVESPNDEFPPIEIHYAETFIVPASVGRYIIRPLGNPKQRMATVKAYLRTNS
jgi:mannose-6-phosphate isomerase class I